jgi:nucleoside-diphosphate-sugar epimerase
MRVLVTGASGFVGGPTCAELRGRGHDVVALVRRPGSEPPGTRAVRGDLADGDALAAALREAAPEGVVHLAAETGSQRDASRIEEVNVRGMERLLAACRAAGVGRVVFVSTVVTGDAHGAVLTEDGPLPVETPYGRSKQEGERLLRDSGLEGVVVRPGHVYGPGGWFVAEFVRRLRRPGRFAVVGRGDNFWDMVHVDDVAGALADALERAPACAVYHCVDDRPLPQREFLALAARELGVGPPRSVPAWLVRLGAGDGPARAVLRSARTSNVRLRRELGWEPRYPTVEAGVPATVAALRGQPRQSEVVPGSA